MDDTRGTNGIHGKRLTRAQAAEYDFDMSDTQPVPRPPTRKRRRAHGMRGLLLQRGNVVEVTAMRGVLLDRGE